MAGSGRKWLSSWVSVPSPTQSSQERFRRLGHVWATELGTALESSSVTERYEVRILIGPCSQEEAEAALEAALFESILPRCPASEATLTPQHESEPDRTR
jgi:hypothetical protein